MRAWNVLYPFILTLYLSKLWWLLVLIIELTLYRSFLNWLSWINLSRLLVSLIRINRLSSSVVLLPRTEVRLAVSRVVRLSCWISLLSWWISLLSCWISRLRSISVIWTSRNWWIRRWCIIYNHSCCSLSFITLCCSNDSSVWINHDDSSSCFHSADTPNDNKKEYNWSNSRTTNSN